MSLSEKYFSFRHSISSLVSILFACKYANDAQIQELLAADKTLLFGENYVKQAHERTVKIPRERYHLIGHLQRNKVRDAIKLFGTIQSVDSKVLLEKISKVAGEEGVTVDIYLQVKLDDNKNQTGIILDELGALISHARLLPNIKLLGLMTLGTIEGDKRACFKTLKSLAQKYLLKTSMGMSEDYIEAIKEGSDMIRLGRIILKN